MENAEISDIRNDLKKLLKEVEFIKNHMVDVDMLLTPEEEARLEEGIEDYFEGRAVDWEDLKKEMKDAEDKAR
jgi:t-SNARE complex subunit (syntaxin)